MSLWWLQPGWTSARCACGKRIWPEGDPDWGACYECFSASLRRPEPSEPQYPGVEDDILAEGEKEEGRDG